tara:strand:- start:1896 stop:2381 length:486 start_codon:yes stop_codon:yes gene_type:complete
MIQAITEASFTAYINTEANRIDTSVATTQIRHLIKFTNDLKKEPPFYSYAVTEVIKSRFTSMVFNYGASPSTFTGVIQLVPAGYWKYEAYEVSWVGTVEVSAGFAPVNENDILTPPADGKGIVQGLVAVGKLYLSERDGGQQVQYTQHSEPTENNYIWYGQ